MAYRQNDLIAQGSPLYNSLVESYSAYVRYIENPDIESFCRYLYESFKNEGYGKATMLKIESSGRLIFENRFGVLKEKEIAV